MKMRSYKESDCAVFYRVRESLGGLSNMSPDFPYRIGDVEIASSEHHYQASRFPDAPEIQELVLAQKTPMAAKRTAYEHIDRTREDWQEGNANLQVMRHCLRCRYVFNRSPPGPSLRAVCGAADRREVPQR